MATTTTTSGTLPDYIQKPVEKALGSIDSWLDSDRSYTYGSRDGEILHTPLNETQNKAIDNVGWLANQDLDRMFNMDLGQNLWLEMANTRPMLAADDYSGGTLNRTMGPASTERLVDENGWLGSIDSYMDPYLEEVLGSQIRRMNEQTERDRRTLGASAQMSGAFGDARHGVMEGQMQDDANRTILDTVGQAHSAAFQNAMAQRAADIARKGGMDQFNINADLQEALANLNSYNSGKDRKLTADINNQAAQRHWTDNLGVAAAALEDNGMKKFDLFNTVNDALFNAGSVQQQDAEERRQSKQDFITSSNEREYQDALKLLSAALGAPYETQQTSTQTNKSDAGIWGLAGSLLGSIFG